MSTLPQAPGVPQAPDLSEPVLRAELERMLQKERRSNLVAFFGTGQAHDIEAKGQRFRVVPTRSELELRGRLAHGDGEGRVFLVDWTQELPLDISCRLASGRLRRIARDTRIATLFGARDVAPELLGSALASAVLSEPELGQRIRPVSGQVLTVDDAYDRYLNALVGLERGATTPKLIAWLAADVDGSATLGERLDASWGQRLDQELRAWLGRRHGKLGEAIYDAWRVGQVRKAIDYAVLVAELASQ